MQNEIQPNEERSDSGPSLRSAESARQLAEEAIAQERASRAALDQARAELAASTLPTPSADAPTPPRDARPLGWRRQALVGAAEVQSGTFDHDRILRAAQAEVAELKATLALARETAVRSREALQSFREQAIDSEELRRSAAAAELEAERLREAVAQKSAEVKARELAQRQFESALSESEARVAERDAALSELTEELRQERQARREAESRLRAESARQDERLALIDNLRAALAGFESDFARPTEPAHNEVATPTETLAPITTDSSSAPEPSEPASMSTRARPAQNEPAPEPADVPAAPSAPPVSAHAQSEPPTQAAPALFLQAEPHTPAPVAAPLVTAAPAVIRSAGLSASAPAPIFDHWLDDQVRRHFGPLGVEDFNDLLTAPLARRELADNATRNIVQIGRGAWGYARPLAEHLVESGSPDFAIHVADADGDHAHRMTDRDSPLHDLMRPLAFPNDPQELAESLRTITPSAFVSRNFLSSFQEIEPWLETLQTLVETGACLVLGEGTGDAVLAPPQEITSLGDRIWSRMPARYTRMPDGDAPLREWAQAFALSSPRSANGLLAGLRSRFTMDLCAQFGFLSEPFVTSPIAHNFDPAAPRDRRFLKQISDLDDRKLEAGLAKPLHMVALIEPEGDAS